MLQNLPAVELQQQIHHPPCLGPPLQRGWAVLPGLQTLQSQLQEIACTVVQLRKAPTLC